MSEQPMPKRTRDADRSREAILDAAETLFAHKGYDGTSLQEIGDRAGVSRGTPNYFFGSKEQLYRAVLERVLEAERVAVLGAQDGLPTTSGSGDAALRAAINNFIDFLVARPTFVQLIEREALANGQHLGETPAFLTVFQAGLVVIEDAAAQGIVHAADPARLLLNIIALCWFPFAHADTFTRGLGIDATDPAFIAQHKQAVLDVVLQRTHRS